MKKIIIISLIIISMFSVSVIAGFYLDSKEDNIEYKITYIDKKKDSKAGYVYKDEDGYWFGVKVAYR